VKHRLRCRVISCFAFQHTTKKYHVYVCTNCQEIYLDVFLPEIFPSSHPKCFVHRPREIHAPNWYFLVCKHAIWQPWSGDLAVPIDLEIAFFWW
jgi:hypothetical protein